MAEFFLVSHDLREFNVLPQDLRTILVVMIFIHMIILSK